MSVKKNLLSDDNIKIIKATIPLLEEHGLEITKEMYSRLLKSPKIAEMFNSSHQGDSSQAKALAMAVLAYAKHIDNLDVLHASIDKIAQKHVSLEIQPEHYPYVATSLKESISFVLKEKATPEVLNAWEQAILILSSILINKEKKLYESSNESIGGWSGWRPFIIANITLETEGIYTVEFRPKNNKPIIRHTPGQYFGIEINIPNIGNVRRNYSITSDPNNNFYSIGIKIIPNGVVSNFLSDKQSIGKEVNISPPVGAFTLSQNNQSPLVFIGAGIGITPLLSMIKEISKYQNPPETRIIQITHSANTSPYIKFFSEISASNHKFSYQKIFTSVNGRPDLSVIANSIPKNSICYLSAPPSLLKELIHKLLDRGIFENNLHYEVFSPDIGFSH